ncbi:MAG: hypothetical protein SGI74_00190 [Oligoflexia bacterium]|nr:hypothetical protein [Oligoflexia bacterium]
MIKLFLVLLSGLVTLPTYAKEVNLKWRAIEGAKLYNLEVATDDSFNKKVIEKSVKLNNLPSNLKPGVYYLRVQAVDALERPGIWSKPFRLAITAPVQPLVEIAEPQKITFSKKSPNVETSWRPAENATNYKVVILKDGKEYKSFETKDPKSDFKPTEPGNYKITVRTGMEGSFGAPTTIQELNIEKKEITAPQLQMGQSEKWSSRKSIPFKWAPVEAAQYYRLKIYKVENGQTDVRSLASTSQPIIDAPHIDSPEYSTGKLPPGKYIAVIEARESDETVAPTTEYQFDVKNMKPIDFDRFDFTARYTVTPIDYSSTMREISSANNKSSTIGGNMLLEGHLWFPDSRWGVKAGGVWGGFSINNTNITYNDLNLAASYKFSGSNKGLMTTIRPYVGGRLWTIPIISRALITAPMQVYTPTLYGPVGGVDITKPLNDTWALTGRMQVSVPLGNSAIGGGGSAGFIKVDPEVSSKTEFGAKYGFKGNMRLLAMAGFQQDVIRWTPNAGSRTQKSEVNMSSPTFSIGIEATDDGGMFRSSENTVREDKFSNFDLTFRYSLTPASYSSKLQENNSQSTSFSGETSGLADIDATGWFHGSNHALRAIAGWGGFTYKNSTVSYPEFMLQWGYRPQIKTPKGSIYIKNFFGLRSWQVPVLAYDQATTQFYSRAPQLLGPANTFQVFQKFSQVWTMRLGAELSAPIVAANKQADIDRILPGAMSHKLDVAFIREFSEDFSVGGGFGYKEDQIQYIPTTSQSGTPSAERSSRAVLTTPAYSVFGVYTF